MNIKNYPQSLGMLLVLIFVILSAAKEVYVGSLVQNMNPVLLCSLCFFLVLVAFSIFALPNLNNAGSISLIKNSLPDFIRLNISTMLFWISSFVGLQYIEPSIAHSISTAVGPIITTIWLSSKGYSKLLLSEIIISFTILAIIVYMIIMSVLGKSGIGVMTLEQVLIGVSCSLISGASIVFNTVFSKNLSKAKISAHLVLATRFYLLIVISFGLIIISIENFVFETIKDNLYGIILLTVFGLALPLFILQKGIEKTDPLIVSFIITLGPIFTFIFEIFDSRLLCMNHTLISILLIVAFALFGIHIRHKSQLVN